MAIEKTKSMKRIIFVDRYMKKNNIQIYTPKKRYGLTKEQAVPLMQDAYNKLSFVGTLGVFFYGFFSIARGLLITKKNLEKRFGVKGKYIYFTRKGKCDDRYLYGMKNNEPCCLIPLKSHI